MHSVRDHGSLLIVMRGIGADRSARGIAMDV